MNTFHFWLVWPLGLTCWSEPYQTASARPGPPDLIQGNTLVASPVAVEPSLTRMGELQTAQPVEALAVLTKICLCAGWVWALVLSLIAQTAKRLRPESIESTEKSVSGESARLSAILIRL